MKRGKLSLCWPQIITLFLLIVSTTACATKLVRPNANDLNEIKSLAIVIPEDKNFTVMYERVKAPPNMQVSGGLPALVIGIGIAKAIDTGKELQDETKTKLFFSCLTEFSCKSIFISTCEKALSDCGRFGNIKFYNGEIDINEKTKFDAIVTLYIENWGLRLIEDIEGEKITPFFELAVEMTETRSKRTLWDEYEIVLGKERRSLDYYQNNVEPFKKEMEGTIEDAGRRVAYTLIYQ